MSAFEGPFQAADTVVRRFLQYWLVANLAEATAYGVAITLSINCLFLLAKSNTTSKRIRRVMMGLVVCMCGVSTTSVILASGGVVRWASDPTLEHVFGNTLFTWGQPFSSWEMSLIVFATWFSDGFMIWRCVMLYHGSSSILRTSVLAFVTLSTLASLTAGICGIITPYVGKIWQQYSILSLFELVSLIVNGSISSLIVLRILYHQRFLRGIFGAEYGSTYTKLMSMLVESAALTFLLGLSHIVIAAAQGKPSVVESPLNMVIIKLIAPINTISPILIIYRVAQGRTWQTDPTKTMEDQQNAHELGDLQGIQFAANESIATMQNSCTLSFRSSQSPSRDDEENRASSDILSCRE